MTRMLVQPYLPHSPDIQLGNMTLTDFLCSCPVDEHLSYKTSDSMYQRFSFTAFQIENAQVMYLHCEVHVCSKNSNSSRCAQGCLQNPGGSTRRKRDETNEFFKTGMTSLGPVRVLLDRVQVSPPEVARKEIRLLMKYLTHLAGLVWFIAIWHP